MVLLQSSMVPLGTPAPDFNLMGVDDVMYDINNFDDKKVLVVIFMCNHCPYVQKIWPDLNGLVERSALEVQFVGINANANPNYPEDSFEKMKEYALKMGQNFPYLYDENQEVAKEYGAVCTPDFFVYDEDRNLAYRGHFDGVEAAVIDLLDGKRPSKDQRNSMGCSIKWVD